MSRSWIGVLPLFALLLAGSAALADEAADETAEPEAAVAAEESGEENEEPASGAEEIHLESVVEGSSGKTFGTEIEFVDEPHFRLVAKEMVNGRPKHDYFLYVKAKLNGVYDLSGGLQEEETFNVGKIDVWGTDDSNRFWMDMHQSQIRFRGQNETRHGPVVGYLEGDFWGGNKGFRLRHLWIDYKFIHFGQDWTFFGDKEIWPNVFDWDGPPSGVWRREPELRFIFKGRSGWQYEFGISNPGAEISFNTDIDDAVEPAYQSAPDFIGAVNKTIKRGHIRATGIYRKLEYKALGTEQSVPGYGATVSGFIGTGKDKRNPVQFQLVAGQGIATYLVSFSGLNYDAAPDGSGNMEAIPTYGGWASYEHWFSKKWHGNIVVGLENFETGTINSYEIPGPDYQATNSTIEANHYYALVNVMYDWLPNLILGLEYNWGNKETVHVGDIDTGTEVLTRLEKDRDARRISFGLFFNY
jgi:hypothetical protein